MLVDNRLINKRPQRLSRLQFGRVGRQKDQPYALGNVQASLAVPAGIVEHQDDGSLRPSARFPRKHCQQRGKERLRDAVMQVPEGFAARRRDKGCDVEPLEAVVSWRNRAFSYGRPNTPRDRLQAEPVFIAGKDLDRPCWVLRRLFRGDGFEFF